MSSNIYDKYAQLKEELEDKDPLKRYARIKQELDTIKQEQVESKVEDTKEKEIKTLESLESLFQFLGGKEDAIETEPEVVEEPAEILPEEVHEVIEEIEEPKSEEKIETVIVEKPITDKTTVDNVAEIITKHEKDNDKKEIVEETDLVAARIDKLEKWIQKIAVAGPGSGEVRLNNLDDVDITGISNNKILKWNASTDKWKIGDSSGSSLAVNEINDNVSNVEVPNVSEIQFDTDSGFALTDMGSGSVKVAMESTFKTWKVSGQSDLVAVAVDTIELKAGTNTTITTDTASTPKSITFNSSGGGGDAFKTITVNGQTNVVADAAEDTLTLIASGDTTLTTDATGDTITVDSTVTSLDGGVF
jgi:hypothetical protein